MKGEDVPSRYEFPNIRKSGEKRNHEISVVTIKDSEGRKKTIVHLLDITKQKKAEESLKITQFSLDKAAIGIYRLDSLGKILDVNNEAIRMLGYSREELIGKWIPEIDPKVNAENWPDIWEVLKKNGKDSFETVHRRKDGTEIHVQINSNLLEYEGNEYSIAFTTDISEIKETEKALKDSLDKLQALYNSLPVIIFSIDKSGIITLAEGRELENLGLTPEQVIGSPIISIYDDPSIPEKIRTCLEGKDCEFNYDLQGTIYHLIISPTMAENGMIQGLNGLALTSPKKKRSKKK